MKSVYLRILLWFVATLAVSLLAFSMVSRFVESRAAGKGGPFARFDALILQEAIGAYELGGPPKLAAYYTDRRQLSRAATFSDRPPGARSCQWSGPVQPAGSGPLQVGRADPDHRAHGGRACLPGRSLPAHRRHRSPIWPMDAGALLRPDIRGGRAGLLGARYEHCLSLAGPGSRGGAIRPRRAFGAVELEPEG